MIDKNKFYENLNLDKKSVLLNLCENYNYENKDFFNYNYDLVTINKNWIEHLKYFYNSKFICFLFNEEEYYNDEEKRNDLEFNLRNFSIIKIFDDSLFNEILNFLEKKKIKKIIDFGCGNGSYVKKFNENGINAFGYDGNPNTPIWGGKNCQILDLTVNFNLYQVNHLSLCLEVGEHIPVKYEKSFIKNLKQNTHMYLIISWGIPGQDGYGHVNCKTNEEVIEKFCKDGQFEYQELESKLFRDSSSFDWFKNTIMVFKRKKWKKV
jgi:hypothetical protein